MRLIKGVRMSSKLGINFRYILFIMSFFVLVFAGGVSCSGDSGPFGCDGGPQIKIAPAQGLADITQQPVGGLNISEFGF